ncbi:hypothetical protein PQR71_12925 [Paraburkholderia fungorum]|uniref:hypothetical protein n=1 Tax=Paraburkholderia fungorum TaxID=134537 RepID=UPI0038B92520
MHAVPSLFLRALALRSSIVDGDTGGAAAASPVDGSAGDAPANQPAAPVATDEHPSHQWLDEIEAEVGAWFIHSTTAQRIRSLVGKARAHLPGRDAT